MAVAVSPGLVFPLGYLGISILTGIVWVIVVESIKKKGRKK